MNASKLSQLAGNQIGDAPFYQRRSGERPSGDVSMFQLILAAVTCAIVLAWMLG